MPTKFNNVALSKIAKMIAQGSGPMPGGGPVYYFNVALFSSSLPSLWDQNDFYIPQYPSNVDMLAGWISYTDFPTREFEVSTPGTLYNTQEVFWTNTLLEEVTISHILLERSDSMSQNSYDWIALALETPVTVQPNKQFKKYPTQISYSVKNP